MEEKEKYLNPYIGGFLLGTVLFAAFFIASEGVGISGAFARMTAQLIYLVDPFYAKNNAYTAHYLYAGNALANWLVVETFGIFLGGYLSAALAGRIKQRVERAEDYPVASRLLFAFLGGALVAFATRLTRGCTSGQALDGISGFSVGAWIFMFSVFAGGMLASVFFRKQWKDV